VDHGAERLEVADRRVDLPGRQPGDELPEGGLDVRRRGAEPRRHRVTRVAAHLGDVGLGVAERGQPARRLRATPRAVDDQVGGELALRVAVGDPDAGDAPAVADQPGGDAVLDRDVGQIGDSAPEVALDERARGADHLALDQRVGAVAARLVPRSRR
jgi:hypothetical protein